MVLLPTVPVTDIIVTLLGAEPEGAGVNDVLTEDGYENDFCPICGVNLVNTMDHFIPQKGYPLFAVHPLNLIPSCDTCNKGKSDNITDKGNRRFWNVYIDKPPKENYLK